MTFIRKRKEYLHVVQYILLCLTNTAVLHMEVLYGYCCASHGGLVRILLCFTWRSCTDEPGHPVTPGNKMTKTRDSAKKKVLERREKLVRKYTWAATMRAKRIRRLRNTHGKGILGGAVDVSNWMFPSP